MLMLLIFLLSRRRLTGVQTEMIGQFLISGFQVVFFFVFLKHRNAPVAFLEKVHAFDEVRQHFRHQGKQYLIILGGGQAAIPLAGNGHIALLFQNGGDRGIDACGMAGHLAMEIMAVDPALHDQQLAGHHTVDMHDNDVGYETAGVQRRGDDSLVLIIFKMR